MRASFVLLALTTACGGSTGELPLGASGPHVDFTAHVDEVAAVFAGSFPGGVHDGGGNEPCAIDGMAFVVETDIGDPIGCTDNEDRTVDTCESATEAGFALDGRIVLGDEAPADFAGGVTIWSSVDGLMVFKSTLTPPESDYARQGLTLLVEGTLLDEATFTGLVWDRILTPETEEPTVRELCNLDFTR